MTDVNRDLKLSHTPTRPEQAALDGASAEPEVAAAETVTTHARKATVRWSLGDHPTMSDADLGRRVRETINAAYHDHRRKLAESGYVVEPGSVRETIEVTVTTKAWPAVEGVTIPRTDIPR